MFSKTTSLLIRYVKPISVSSSLRSFFSTLLFHVFNSDSLNDSKLEAQPIQRKAWIAKRLSEAMRIKHAKQLHFLLIGVKTRREARDCS